MVKVTLTRSIRYGGRRHAEGVTLDVPDETAERWGRHGIASAVATQIGEHTDGGYPAGFPGAHELEAAGITLDEVQQMTAEDLMEVDGIGRATAAKIIAAR